MSAVPCRPHNKLKGAPEPKHEWDRRRDESAVAYAAFVAYRNLGENRSLAKAAKEIAKPKRMLATWSSRNEWVMRAAVWDRHELESADAVRRDKRHRRIVEMEERHLAIALAFQNKLIERLQTMKASELSPSDVVQWLWVAVKVERLALGLSTGNTRIVGNVIAIAAEIAHTTTLVIQDPDASRLAHMLLARIAEAERAEVPAGGLP